VSVFRIGALFGSIAMAAYLLFSLGVRPFDGFTWTIFVLMVVAGGMLAGGVVLTWRHAIDSPRVLIPTALALVLLSLPLVFSYRRDLRATPAFLAGADSTRGEIIGRNVFGNLLVTYRPNSSARARIVADRKRAHKQLGVGDSIWVYRQREAPHKIDVWPPGPDAGSMMTKVAWLWVAGGILIAGYGPVARRWLHRPNTGAG